MMHRRHFVHCHLRECHPVFASSELDKQHFKKQFWNDIDWHFFTNFWYPLHCIDVEALYILSQDVNNDCLYSARHHSVYGKDI
jgi:hypothetical protein